MGAVRRAVPLVLSLLLVVAACTRATGVTRPAPTGADFTITPYRGLGTWVDVFDYVPAFQRNGAEPNVTPDSVDDIANLGVRTLFLQVAIDDPRAEGPIAAPALVDRCVRRARERGVAVVAWYLPKFADVERDLSYVKAIADHRVDGLGFDGFALDIEWTQDVRDAGDRNARLVDLSRRARDLVGRDRTLGAIVYPAVQAEVINPALWPQFPYAALDPLYDVWLPMAYWTFRSGDYRDAYRYTEESVRRLRAGLGNPSAKVAPVGGIGDLATVADYGAFMRAVRDTGSIGWSMYDFDTTRSSHWRLLRPTAPP